MVPDISFNTVIFVTALLHPENPLQATLSCSAVEALRVIELPRHEYLLIFGTLAAYVDRHGRRSREREIMYPAVPTAISIIQTIFCWNDILCLVYFRLSRWSSHCLQ